MYYEKHGRKLGKLQKNLFPDFKGQMLFTEVWLRRKEDLD
jgi:hypothetical protein